MKQEDANDGTIKEGQVQNDSIASMRMNNSVASTFCVKDKWREWRAQEKMIKSNDKKLRMRMMGMNDKNQLGPNKWLHDQDAYDEDKWLHGKN